MSPNTMRPTTPPATQKTRLCHQISRLPRTVPRRHRDHKRHPCHTRLPHKSTKGTPLSPTNLRKKSNVDVTNAKRHACHSKSRRARGTKRATGPRTAPKVPRLPHGGSVSATKRHPATQGGCRCRQGPCLPQKSNVDVTKFHACCAATLSATPATRQQRQCHQGPRLPHSAALAKHK